MIAKEAGVSNGSLFLYFATKTTLLNELYVALKSEMGAAAVQGFPAEGLPREQARHVWDEWLRWATSCPQKRRALAQLEVSDEVTAESRRMFGPDFASVTALLERVRVDGPVRDAPLGFVLALTTAMADTTVDAVIRDPDRADVTRRAGFEALWGVLAGPSPCRCCPTEPRS